MDKNSLNRYEEAKKEHFDMYMNQSKTIHTWKIMTLIMSLFFAVSFSLCVYLTTRTSLVPYIVKVDGNGVPKVLGELDKIEYTPTEAEYNYFVREFISRARAIPRDQVLYNINYRKNSFYLKEESLSKYNAMIQDMNVTEKLKLNYAVEVNIISCQKIANTENTFQIRWEEKEYDNTGLLKMEGSKRLSCILVVRKEKIEKLEEIENNPLGLKIVDFNLTKEN